MIRSAIIVCLSFAGVACGSRVEDIPYGFRAVERPNPKMPEEDSFVPNARQALPQILVACGVNEFRLLRGEEGELSFQFDMPADKETKISRCVEKRAPKGAYLGPVYTL
jgi:hypothetical protein